MNTSDLEMIQYSIRIDFFTIITIEFICSNLSDVMFEISRPTHIYILPNHPHELDVNATQDQFSKPS